MCIRGLSHCFVCRDAIPDVLQCGDTCISPDETPNPFARRMGSRTLCESCYTYSVNILENEYFLDESTNQQGKVTASNDAEYEQIYQMYIHDDPIINDMVQNYERVKPQGYQPANELSTGHFDVLKSMNDIDINTVTHETRLSHLSTFTPEFTGVLAGNFGLQVEVEKLNLRFCMDSFYKYLKFRRTIDEFELHGEVEEYEFDRIMANISHRVRRGVASSPTYPDQISTKDNFNAIQLRDFSHGKRKVALRDALQPAWQVKLEENVAHNFKGGVPLKEFHDQFSAEAKLAADFGGLTLDLENLAQVKKRSELKPNAGESLKKSYDASSIEAQRLMSAFGGLNLEAPAQRDERSVLELNKASE